MIRAATATEGVDLMNSQPWSDQHVNSTTQRPPVGKSKSVNQIFDIVSDVVNETKEQGFRGSRRVTRRNSVTASTPAKSDLGCDSPSKSSHKAGALTVKSSPVSVVDSDEAGLGYESGNERLSVSLTCPEKSLLQQFQPLEIYNTNNNSIGPSALTNSLDDDESEHSFLADKLAILGSIPRSLKISSSNFSTRSDITAPTIFEPPSNEGRLSPTTMKTSDVSRGIASIDCAPMQPRRRGSNDGEIETEGGGIPRNIHCPIYDSCPTKPSRQSSIRGLKSVTDFRHSSFRTSHSTDLSPMIPRRQKSGRSIISRENDARTSVSSITLRSNPPMKPKREKSVRSLNSSGSCVDSRKDRLTRTLQESIMEETTMDEL